MFPCTDVDDVAAVLTLVAQRCLVDRPATERTLADANAAADGALCRHFGDGWRARWLVDVIERDRIEPNDRLFALLQGCREPGAQVAAYDERLWRQAGGGRWWEILGIAGVEVRTPSGETWCFGTTENTEGD